MELKPLAFQDISAVNSVPEAALEAWPKTPMRLRNLRYGTYLYETHNQIKYCTPAQVDAAAGWIIEELQGWRRFKNQLTGNYITIEGQHPYVQSISVEDDWLSACWQLEYAAGLGHRIRSAWRNWQVLQIDVPDHYVQCGSAFRNEQGAFWVLER